MHPDQFLGEKTHEHLDRDRMGLGVEVIIFFFFLHFQINMTGKCDSDTESIEVTIAATADISMTSQGACLSLYGNESLEVYREILLTAR